MSDTHNTSFTFINVLEEALDYCMEHQNAGKCLIFNHEQFDVPNYSQRKGTQMDVQRIESFFKDRLDFEVETHEDLTMNQLMQTIQTVSLQDFKHYNCFVCCILTHGTENQLLAKDGKYKLEQIISFFTAERCQSLAGKPKLFFIQACQGDKIDPGHDIRVRSSGDVNHNNIVLETCDVTDGNEDYPIITVRIPICADILVAYASFPKFCAYRNIERGSWFFQVLLEVFEQHYEEHDLVTILMITKRRIAFEKQSNEAKKQIPWITDTLTRRVYFKKLSTQTQVQVDEPVPDIIETESENSVENCCKIF